MFKKTDSLIKGVKQMLKNRGSMTVKEVQLLEDVIDHLEKHKKLKGDQKFQNGVTVVNLLLRFIMNPGINDKITNIASNLIDKLL
jgi:hypothetical protein